MENRKEHWERIYSSKQQHEVSWTQAVPHTSLNFIHDAGLPQDAPILDVGGGDSRLVDFLLDEGYTNITVLDISAHALEKAKTRLGERADKVQWVVSDILEYRPSHTFAVWHDRAAFHFLTDDAQVEHYRSLLRRYASAHVITGTFSDQGPTKCSNLSVRQYTEETLQQVLAVDFDKQRCITVDHVTPFDTKQNFLFCHYKKR